ncbi:MAG: hypothetical protein RR135_06720, partial [Oscillospiraceae bacterium]
QYGTMAPHFHGEELIYVLNASHGIVRYGKTEACDEGQVTLRPDMLLHFADKEWHVFEFSEPDGYSDILFFYPQTVDVRPETNVDNAGIASRK